MMPKMNKETPISGRIALLTQWLDEHELATMMAPGVLLYTTDDIINELADMCELEPNEIADTLIELGYRFHVEKASGNHGWMIKG